MKSIRAILLTLMQILSTAAVADHWGRPDSPEKLDPNPWMWSLRGNLYDHPEAAAAAIGERRGIWAGIFSWFLESEEEWNPFEEIEHKVLWRAGGLAIVHGSAEAFRAEACAVWIVLKHDRSSDRWILQDALVRRDVGYSHVETKVLENVAGVAGPILFIDTYRGGRRLGGQSYELYRIEEAPGAPCARLGRDACKPLRFARCLCLRTRYSQRNSWRGSAGFSVTPTRKIKVAMSRGNMMLDQTVCSEVELAWDPGRKAFDVAPLERFIGLERLQAEDRKTEGIR